MAGLKLLQRLPTLVHSLGWHDPEVSGRLRDAEIMRASSAAWTPLGAYVEVCHMHDLDPGNHDLAQWEDSMGTSCHRGHTQFKSNILGWTYSLWQCWRRMAWPLDSVVAHSPASSYVAAIRGTAGPRSDTGAGGGSRTGRTCTLMIRQAFDLRQLP